ncbi:MAG: hypothetical protein Q9227_000569 [Pyrenula ochraceoflavens]
MQAQTFDFVNLEPPSKKRRLSKEANDKSLMDTESLSSDKENSAPRLGAESSCKVSSEEAREASLGIQLYVSSSTSQFAGILKKRLAYLLRYTDFQVNEILLDGTVLHFKDLKPGASSHTVGIDNDKVPLPSGEVATDSVAGNATYSNQPSKTPLENEQQLSNNPDNINRALVSEADRRLLESYLEPETTSKLIELYDSLQLSGEPNRKAETVVSIVTPERSMRTALHSDIRRIFSSRIESFTDKDGVMKFAPARNAQHGRDGNRHGRPRVNWNEKGGDYLHFSIYKENRDTMEVISHLCRQTRTSAKSFQFAGTKDKRAVTVQRASAFRIDAHQLAAQNRNLRGSAVGDFQHQKQSLELGDLRGNEFYLTLRDCSFGNNEILSGSDKLANAKAVVSKAMQDLWKNGFFNFYGLQRFGTFSTTTDEIGMKLLCGKFEDAVNAILYFSPDALSSTVNTHLGEKVGHDDKARAEAIAMFLNENNAHLALEKLPRKFSAEANIIRHLRKSRNDCQGALGTIPRNLRLMYVHAYQSLVWNHAVNHRWKIYGHEVVEGDLVLINEHKERAEASSGANVTDVDGEAIILPANEDSAQSTDDAFERARALTAAEAISGNYSIFDVVLPLPGYDVLYPPNQMTDFYKSFMASEKGGGLDPFDMRRKQKDYSLSGSYRKIIARIGENYEVDVRSYSSEDEQFVETDMDRIQNAHQNNQQRNEDTTRVGKDSNTRGQEDREKLAVILKFQLGSSQYATMALREISKGGIAAWKPDFGGGR